MVPHMMGTLQRPAGEGKGLEAGGLRWYMFKSAWLGLPLERWEINECSFDLSGPVLRVFCAENAHKSPGRWVWLRTRGSW